MWGYLFVLLEDCMVLSSGVEANVITRQYPIMDETFIVSLVAAFTMEISERDPGLLPYLVTML